MKGPNWRRRVELLAPSGDLATIPTATIPAPQAHRSTAMPSLGCSQRHHPPAQEEGGSRQHAEGYAWLRSPWMSPSPGDVLILDHVVGGGGRFECDSEVRRIWAWSLPPAFEVTTGTCPRS
jgi:hypothetical protein